MTDKQRPEADEAELLNALEAEIEDPIGDETGGEEAAAAGPETEGEIAAAEDTAEARAEADPAFKDEQEADDAEDEAEPEFTPKPRPPANLERLQKILAAAGVASRRKAEEMIEQGRVQVNGKVVTELGTKADAGRDHIRVDGKLLQGAERLRYFVLNKPRGFVTTVKDPEGRPTVMQFFDKMRERLYPVGRLDYMSEGLLLVTNDGELANKLTRAAAGVEKTYLAKVAGKPTESELDILRAGVAIEKGKPGSGKVRTSPARIRQVRQGDNPWYEVVLIEGRNRELRKMFEEVGHFVEKIRRVGYGPLILDQEPGHLRELDAQELELLRKAADGTLRTPKAKEIRRRNIVDSLPPEKPAFKPRGAKPAAGPKDYRPKRSFGAEARFGADRGRHGRRTTGLEARRPDHRRDLLLGQTENVARRQAEATETGRLRGGPWAQSRRQNEPTEANLRQASRSEPSRQPAESFRPGRHGRNPHLRNGRLTRGHRPPEPKQRAAQPPSRLRGPGRRGHPDCALSRFTRLGARIGTGWSVRVQTGLRQCVQGWAGRELDGRERDVPAPRVRSAARAGWPGRSRAAAASRAPAGLGPAVNQARRAGAHSVPGHPAPVRNRGRNREQNRGRSAGPAPDGSQGPASAARVRPVPGIASGRRPAGSRRAGRAPSEEDRGRAVKIPAASGLRACPKTMHRRVQVSARTLIAQSSPALAAEEMQIAVESTLRG